MPTKPTPPLAWWRVVIIRKRGERVGRVQARTADEAIRIAAERYGLDPRRLAAARIGTAEWR